jgi:hypothetical protein
LIFSEKTIIYSWTIHPWGILMNSARQCGSPVRTPWAGIALSSLFLVLSACAGGASSEIPAGAVPGVPALSVPATGTTGFPVTVSVQGPSSRNVYTWTIAPATATFKGGSATASGSTVVFTSSTAGTVNLTCIATVGNALVSQPAAGSVTINPPATAAGTFQAAGSLLQGRLGLAAALLPNGTILVTGGSASASGPALNSTEIYNPATQTSLAGPVMNTARANHAVAPINGTQFLITGGGAAPVGTPPNNPNSEIYDSGLAGFAVPSGLMASNRAYHTATSIVTPAGVLIAGGLTAAGIQLNSEELYSSSTQTFTAAGTVTLAPYHTATRLPSGKVLLVSHTGGGSSWAPFATIYDPATQTFSAPANQPQVPREGHQAILLPSLDPPKVLILGGSAGSGPVASAEWFDPGTSLFSPVGAAMASPREDFGAAILPSNQVLLVGGSADGGSADGSSALATSEIFDPVAQTFTPAANLGAARTSPTVFQLPTGTILVLGGSGPQGPVAAVESF